MKHLLLILTMFLAALSVSAEQENRKFNPQQFQKDQETFIQKFAQLTPQEATVFFPLFREMQEKQRTLFGQQMKLTRQRPANDKEAAKQITQMDEVDMKLTKLKAQYHARFCRVIPATKVKKCIMAEERFKHHVMEKLAKGPRPGGPRPPRMNKK